MIRYLVSILNAHSDHPILAFLIVTSGAMLVVAAAVSQLTGGENAMFSGFITVYAVVAAFMAATGYGVLYVSRLASILVRQFEPSSRGSEAEIG